MATIQWFLLTTSKLRSPVASISAHLDHRKQMWYQNDQKGVNFNIPVNICQSRSEFKKRPDSLKRIWPFFKFAGMHHAPLDITSPWESTHKWARTRSVHWLDKSNEFWVSLSRYVMSASFSHKIICLWQWSVIHERWTTFALFFIILALTQGNLHYICVMLND